jgi:hypothetical protein
MTFNLSAESDKIWMKRQRVLIWLGIFYEMSVLCCKTLSVCVIAVVIHVDGLRQCLWTAATNGPIVHPPDDKHGTTMKLYCQRKTKNRLKASLSVTTTSSNINPTRDDTDATPVLQVERQAINCLSHGTTSLTNKTDSHVLHYGIRFCGVVSLLYS